MSKKVQKMQHEGVTDRRVQRTKKLLWDSLVKLILKKGYDAVTIQDILDEANIGRSTFYSHYENKEQLLFSGQPHLTKLLFEDKEDNARIDFKAVFLHAKENKPLAKALLGKQGSNLLVQHIQQVMQYKLEKSFGGDHSNESEREVLKSKFLIEAAAVALVNLLSNWIEQDMPLSIDEMADMSNRMVYILTNI